MYATIIIFEFTNTYLETRHIKRVALGVPEDKVCSASFIRLCQSLIIEQWDKLFEEIARVMKPGAPFEVRLFFSNINPSKTNFTFE